MGFFLFQKYKLFDNYLQYYLLLSDFNFYPQICKKRNKGKLVFNQFINSEFGV